jgi:methyl-accepting chemotaxis protein
LGIKNIKIGVKLLGGFLMVIALLVLVFSFGFYGLNKINDNAVKIYDRSNENYLWQQWKAYLERETVYYIAYSLNPNPHYLEEAHNKIENAKQVRGELAKIVPAERQQEFDAISAKSDQVAQLAEATVAFLNNKDQENAIKNMGAWEALDNELIAGIDKSIESSKAATEAALATSSQTKNSMALMMILGCIAAVVFAIGIAMYLSSTISKGINKVKKALEKMAAGDLTERVNISSRDEVGAMAKAYDETQNNLNKLIAQLKASAIQLSSASDQLAVASKQSSESTQQVATSSQQMAKGAQEQSTNTQETANSVKQLTEVIDQLARGAYEQSTEVQKAVASLTEVSRTITEVADNANLAATGAKQAAESANLGTEKSKLTLAGMDKIKLSTGEAARKIEELGSRSAEIGKIVAVIDDIAAQTNLLALNAAIEAARAGEQGRGFAVVSDEVRKLAERSATATKEIADLIGNVQKGVNEAMQVMAVGSEAVNDGYNLAVEAGQALDQIRTAASAVNSKIDQISSRTQKVNAETNQLVKVMDSVGRITEESNAATETMSANATQVSKAVETIAGIAEENSAATEEVSAAAEEMSAQVEEIVASAQTLKEMAVNLEECIAMFKVETESANTPIKVKAAMALDIGKQTEN